MTEDDVPPAVSRALAAHDAVEVDEDACRVSTTVFDATVTATATDGGHTRYVVTVTVPSLAAATSDPVGEAVADGWFDTLERRLADATTATRESVTIDELTVDRRGLDVVVTYAFAFGDADRAVEIAKTLVEYVEGTYVEGVVPGYEYEPPVADLLSRAETGGDAERGGTPL